jgi:hypothetical protein
MSSPERNITAEPPEVEARLASLEGEAARLRAEVAELQEELCWLSGDEGTVRWTWLGAGWVRASLLLTAVALVTIVSVPYLLHLLDPSGRPADPAPAQAAESTPAMRPVARVPRPPARQHVPIPARVHSTEIPAPAYIAAEERLVAPSRPAGRSGRPTPPVIPSGQTPNRRESP